DNPGAHLRGTARSPSGPLDGAIIRLSGPLRATLRTDGNGYFGVPGLPPGSYAVTLEHGGAIRVHTVADLHAGRMLTLDLAVGE
ncbi:MAG: carboxypeptidase-like regulatory domain-containing protein, partial [Chloroflexota bacterium]